MTAALLASHLLLALVLSASPVLHQLLHHDANAAGHVCVVITLKSGGCDAPGSDVVLSAFEAVLLWVEPRPEIGWVDSIFLAGAVLEHAPPALLS